MTMFIKFFLNFVGVGFDVQVGTWFQDRRPTSGSVVYTGSDTPSRNSLVFRVGAGVGLQGVGHAT